METMALLNSDPTEALEFISDAIDDRSTGGGTEGKSSEAVGFVFLSGIFGLEGEFTASINGSETVIAPEANAGEGEAKRQKIDISDNSMLLFLISKPLVCADFRQHLHAHRTHFDSVRRTHPHTRE